MTKFRFSRLGEMYCAQCLVHNNRDHEGPHQDGYGSWDDNQNAWCTCERFSGPHSHLDTDYIYKMAERNGFDALDFMIKEGE